MRCAVGSPAWRRLCGLVVIALRTATQTGQREALYHRVWELLACDAPADTLLDDAILFAWNATPLDDLPPPLPAAVVHVNDARELTVLVMTIESALSNPHAVNEEVATVLQWLLLDAAGLVDSTMLPASDLRELATTWQQACATYQPAAGH